jgi:phage baseplate assembly protein W
VKDKHDDQAFLGQGLAFPLQVNSRGELALVQGDTDIEQSIRIILGTAPGERVMRPEFGCRIHELIFAPHNPATEGLIKYYVKQALGWWEPRIEVDGVDVSPDSTYDSALFVEIIYPFFLMGEEE